MPKGENVSESGVESNLSPEPVVTDVDEWFRVLDRFAQLPFMEEGRQQPPMPPPEDAFE
jgi:antitoxin VapB